MPLEQRQYVVVLKQAASEAEALQAAQSLRKQIPTAQAVRANNNYFVVLAGAPSGETDALLAATRAKRTLGEKVQPVLVEVRQ